MRKLSALATSAALFGLLAATPALAATQVRVMWYSDGVEGEVLDDLVKRFEAANPDIDIVVDHVAYNVIRNTLPVQLESGKGPDIARVTELKTLAKHWLDLRPMLKNAKYWDDNFANYLDWMREDKTNALTGFMTQVTITGPFVNKTLFDQAGVKMPGDKATWDDWAKAVKEVADKQSVPMALAFDRSGHRFAGPAISMGAKFLDASGNPAVIDDGFKAMAERIAKWHEDGTMPKEIWGGVSGTTYKGANEEFSNGQLVMYMSGSWQIPQFAKTIGNNFDWMAVPNPCGPGGCTGMPGGAGLVAVKYTKSPEAVAKVMEYLASAPVMKEFAERTLFIPANDSLAKQALEFKTNDAQVKGALNAFVKETSKFADTAKVMPANKWSSVIYSVAIARLGQVVAGEIPLADAYTRINEDIKQKMAEAK
ncbi:ABC transporter substrate-binding protein [Lacibacterium aquatile]|uniref:sn-glycerol-3-phosphate-binding periplasmic protein UgpB n=1 Tax=Lacibacterium aquatile TaxID=1168082 RepID=A0ABW5DLB3_9PROT